jgi:hypothetical protein
LGAKIRLGLPKSRPTTLVEWADDDHFLAKARLVRRDLDDQDLYRERTTGFEPATLTLAKRRISSANTTALR